MHDINVFFQRSKACWFFFYPKNIYLSIAINFSASYYAADFL